MQTIKRFILEKLPFLSMCLLYWQNEARHRRSKLRVRRLLKGKRELLIEVGSGDRKGENGWTTIDIMKHCDIFWDVRRGIPFPDGSVSKIYSSHFLEHLSFAEGQRFLGECKRVLVTDGMFSVCVPDARLYLEAYAGIRVLDDQQFFDYPPGYNNTTKIDIVNYTAYMNGQHHYMFDEENLVHLLRAHGFRNVRLRPFDPELDRKVRDFESIYAEGIK